MSFKYLLECSLESNQSKFNFDLLFLPKVKNMLFKCLVNPYIFFFLRKDPLIEGIHQKMGNDLPNLDCSVTRSSGCKHKAKKKLTWFLLRGQFRVVSFLVGPGPMASLEHAAATVHRRQDNHNHVAV